MTSIRTGTASDTMESGQRLGEISGSKAADRLGLTTNAIGQWAARPGAPARKDGRRLWVRWPDFARWREQELLRQAKEESAEGSLSKRLQAANAEAAEVRLARERLELARAQELLVDAREVEETVGKVLDRLMALLRSFATRFSELGPHAEEVIEREVERAIEQLHSFDEDLLEVPEDDEGHEAAEDEAA